MLRGKENNRAPYNAHKTADLAWQIVKLTKFETYTTLTYVRNKLNPSPTRLHMAMKWLTLQGFIARTGDQMVLTSKGYQFYDARKAVLDD